MSEDYKKFNSKFDALTRTVAKHVNNFFSENELNEMSGEELKNNFQNYIQNKFSIQLQNVEVDLKKIEGGYTGFVKTTSLNRPLFFERLTIV